MFAQNLKYLRKKFDMDQETLAAKLGRKSTSTISEWESGKYTPKAGVLSDIAKIFGISLEDLMSTDLSEDKANITTIYNQLTPDRQQNVYTYADEQLKEQQAGNVIAMPTPDDNFAEVSADGVLSAGVGEWLDGTDSGFMVKVKKPLPASYDYVFQINGHSMEPYFKDKQVVFAEEHEEYRNGQIVAAIVDGNAYLKRLDCDGEIMTLESLNPEYPNINVYEDDDYKILGVVFA
ncbi:XRE family transcriptional regulator [Lactiplantibacillus plantarum]|uniref:S24 family peptidase n=1 Tax=Lactiplantibacillus plantarum TaxID=1590 RepID=UPI001BA7024E|nr:XRE family transcriptional regulator [Lactiplantibacillus plantarum]MBS0953361.1 LexA family transcriptional regulator [Lactiplantibacillus plantarum]